MPHRHAKDDWIVFYGSAIPVARQTSDKQTLTTYYQQKGKQKITEVSLGWEDDLHALPRRACIIESANAFSGLGKDRCRPSSRLEPCLCSQLSVGIQTMLPQFRASQQGLQLTTPPRCPPSTLPMARAPSSLRDRLAGARPTLATRVNICISAPG